MKLDMRYTRYYAFMDTQLMLRENALSLFALIYSFHEAGKKCSASIAYLAQRINASESTVIRAIKRLEGDGLITVIRTGRLLEFKVNEDGIYRRASELAANKATAPASDDENDCAFEDEDADKYEDEDKGDGADGGDGADDGDGDYPTGTYGGNSAHERGEDAYERKTAGKVPKYASNSAEEALYHALCRTYGSELAKEIIKYH